ncbi:MAG: hypothetical protein Kow0042_09970 [Calditrichia bacterium]
MVETGTIFRILTSKPNFPGDILQVNTLVNISEKKNIPFFFELDQNYPNPFNPVTRIHFSLASSEKVKLEIYNVLGQRVKTLVNQKMTAGKHSINWDGRNEAGKLMGSGVYFYRLKAGDFTKTKKMILIK